jgi:dihydrofolate reductase
MRKLTLGLATSLDNYIAREDDGTDWLRWNQEVARISAKFMKTVDALLIGRRTYEVILASGQTSYPGARNYVFSRTKKTVAVLTKRLANIGEANVEVIHDDAPNFVKRLKSDKGKGIALFGGGELAQALFAADLIDEVVLNIQPVILGSGIPLFPENTKQIDLTFLRARPLKDGGLVVSYRVKH